MFVVCSSLRHFCVCVFFSRIFLFSSLLLENFIESISMETLLSYAVRYCSKWELGKSECVVCILYPFSHPHNRSGNLRSHLIANWLRNAATIQTRCVYSFRLIGLLSALGNFHFALQMPYAMALQCLWQSATN